MRHSMVPKPGSYKVITVGGDKQQRGGVNTNPVAAPHSDSPNPLPLAVR